MNPGLLGRFRIATIAMLQISTLMARGASGIVVYAEPPGNYLEVIEFKSLAESQESYLFNRVVPLRGPVRDLQKTWVKEVVFNPSEVWDKRDPFSVDAPGFGAEARLELRLLPSLARRFPSYQDKFEAMRQKWANALSVYESKEKSNMMRNRRVFAFLQTAAASGNSEAMCNLGVCYANGFVVARDGKRAFDLFKQAAELGQPSAMFYLSGFYSVPPAGVTADEEAANDWLKKSAEAGCVPAKERVAALQRQAAAEAKAQAARERKRNAQMVGTVVMGFILGAFLESALSGSSRGMGQDFEAARQESWARNYELGLQTHAQAEGLTLEQYKEKYHY